MIGQIIILRSCKFVTRFPFVIIIIITVLSGLDVAKMLSNRIQKLSEEKFTELSVQLQSIPNADNLKKVCNNCLIFTI